MDFSDVSPWDETIKDDPSDQPSFSTPAKSNVSVEVSAPTRLMSKIFQKQINHSNEEISRAEKTRQAQTDEIAQLKKDLENQLAETKVSKIF